MINSFCVQLEHSMTLQYKLFLFNKGRRVVHLAWDFFNILFAMKATLCMSRFSFNNAKKAGNVGGGGGVWSLFSVQRYKILRLRCTL